MRLTVERYTFFAVLFLGGLWWAKSLQIPNNHIIALNDNDAGKKVVIKKGQVFTLTLADHIDGGYRFDTIQYNTTVITLKKHSETPPPPGSPPGRSGTSTWFFTAIKKSETPIRVSATRPWKGGGTVTVFENKVVVK